MKESQRLKQSPGQPNQHSGQSLIELLITLAAISVIMVTLVGAATRAVSVQTSARAESQATKLTEEQIERVRAYRDREGFTQIQALSCAEENTCYLDEDLSLGSPPSGSQFTVWFSVTDPVSGSCPAENKSVTAVSQWTDPQGSHESRLTTCLSDWRQ